MPMFARSRRESEPIDVADSDPRRPKTGDPVFARNLRALRKSAGLSQAQLAALIEREQNTISDYERARSKPEMPEIRRLAAVLRVDMGKLTGATGRAMPQGAADFMDRVSRLSPDFWQRIDAMSALEREQTANLLASIVRQQHPRPKRTGKPRR